MTAVPVQLAYKTCWHAPGYRDLRFVLTDEAGTEYELHLPPRDVQRVIYDCADAARQINDHPPLDWEQWRARLDWPEVTPWMDGPRSGAQS